ALSQRLEQLGPRLNERTSQWNRPSTLECREMGIHPVPVRMPSERRVRMMRLWKMLGLGLLTTLAGLVLVACGGGGGGGGGGTSGGTATVLMGTAPDYLDPAESYTTQGAEADWIAYTPLLTYRHEAGDAGGQLIPGLATALPDVSADNKTYTLTLRKGLVYSNGQPVKASDFPYTIERSIKLNWG